MADIGTAYIRIAPNMSGIQGKIAAGMKGAGTQATQQLAGEVNSSSGKFQKALGGLSNIAKTGGKAIAVGMGIGIAGVTALTTKMLNSGAELEQQLGGAEAVFGKYADGIKTAAQDAYKNAGLSQNEFLQGANKMGSLFQGAGFDVESSMKMSSDSMQRAADIASIMGISTTDALEAVTGMAKGNFTMMDNLGVAMNDTAIGAYALSKGINKSTAQMSIQEKVGLAQQMFMEKTAKYAGNYAKENDTLSGSLNTTKKAFDNFLSGGGSIDDFVNSLVNTIKVAIPKIVEILPNLVQGIGSVLTGLIPVLQQSLPVLLPALINAAKGLLDALVQALPGIIKLLVGALPAFIDAFIEIFLGIVQALPEIIKILADAIPQIVDSLVTGLTSPEALTAMIMGTIELFLAMIEAVPVIVAALTKAIPTIIQNIVATLTSPEFTKMMFSASVDLMKALISGFVSNTGAVISMAWQIIKIIGGILSPSNMIRIGGDMIRGLWNGIKDLTGWILDKIKGFGGQILGSIKSFFGIHSPSTVFAEIGNNLNRGLAQGITSTAGLVQNSITDMSNQALSALGGSDLSASYSLTGTGITPSSSRVANTTSNSQNVTIHQVTLGDQGAVREFFRQLNQDTINSSFGLTPNQGAIA